MQSIIVRKAIENNNIPFERIGKTDLRALRQSTNEVIDEEFDKVFAVNVKAIFHSTSVLVPYLQKQGTGGSFVTTASTAGIRPRGGLTWYNASKAAVINASKSMAVEYAKDNIRFNTVCPVVGLGTGL